MKLRIKHFACLCLSISIGIAICIFNKHFKVYPLFNNNGNSSSIDAFSILTYNIDASDSTKFTLSYQDSLLNLLKTVNADVICFQELSVNNHRRIKPRLDSLYKYSDLKQSDDQIWGVYFNSRYPMREFKRYKTEGKIQTEGLSQDELEELELYKMQMNVMSGEFEIEPNKWVTIFFGHLRSNSYSTARRSMDKEVSWFDGISLYQRNYEIGKRIRDYEAKNVRRFVNNARKDGIPVIVAGDFNDWCGSDCLNTLMGDDLQDAWWEGGTGFGWTYYGWHLRLRIDHVLYSKELELVDVKVVDTDLSDHKPLMASFKLK